MTPRFLHTWNHLHTHVMLLFGVLSLFTELMEYVLIGAAMSFAILILGSLILYRDNLAILRLPNWITFARLVLLMAAIEGFSHLSTGVFTGMIIAVLVLDGVDGYLARRMQAESTFGAMFDMESDALLGALLSLLIYHNTEIGGWILIPGFLRYLFVIIRYLSYLENVEVTEAMPGNKTIAVVFFICLLAAFVFPLEVVIPALIVSGASIVFSFAREFVFLVRARKAQTGSRPLH